MPLVSQVFAVVAAALHVLFFLFESVLFGRMSTQKRFHVEPEHAAAVRPWAFNQGFCNLFLASGIAAGLVIGSRPLLLFPCACMLGAGMVLLLTDRRMARAAATQAVPPLVVIIAAMLR